MWQEDDSLKRFVHAEKFVYFTLDSEIGSGGNNWATNRDPHYWNYFRSWVQKLRFACNLSLSLANGHIWESNV